MRFSQLFEQGGDELEVVADDAVVGHFEEESVRVFIDGRNRARTPGHTEFTQALVRASRPWPPELETRGPLTCKFCER